MTGAKELTPRQARFVDEYLIDLNGTQAAIRAGYSTLHADVQASRLLGYAKVKTAVEAAKAALLERTEGTQERVIEKLWRVHDASMGDKPLIAKDGKEWGAQFNPAAANKSLELIGKHGGMWQEGHVAGDINIQVNVHPHDKGDG